MDELNLSAYKGPLTAEQVAQGINAANQNARRLLEDASILLEHKSFSTAASLAALSIEEAGKAPILRRLALAQSNRELKQCWRDYRSHTQKNMAWIIPSIASHGALHLDDLRPAFDPSSEHPNLLNQLKQAGFYTDCFGNCTWSIPYEEIDEQLAFNLIQTARALVMFREVTLKEVEIWIKHMRPVWRRSAEDIERGLVQWYREMCAQKLITGKEDDMEKFIYKHHSTYTP
ncbi:MAG TPA: AbiV family abortive infection protein [Desulfobacteria bacterium]|nr:AbiV family abortive infection protein [Desulfobacteria bacterium]